MNKSTERKLFDYVYGRKKYLGLDSPSAVRAWAIRNKWSPHAADDLAGIVRSLREGRRLRGGRDFRCTKKVIKWLQERAKEKLAV